MVVMFNAREPGIFNNFGFCVFWANAFEFLQRVSTMNTENYDINLL